MEAQLGRVLPSVARVIRIGRGKKVDADWAVRTDLFEQPQEDALYQAYQAVAAEVRQPPEPHPLCLLSITLSPSVAETLRVCHALVIITPAISFLASPCISDHCSG